MYLYHSLELSLEHKLGNEYPRTYKIEHKRNPCINASFCLL